MLYPRLLTPRSWRLLFVCLDCLLHGRGGSFPTQCINPVQLRARVGRALIIPVYAIKKPVGAGHERERGHGGRFIHVEGEGGGEGRNARERGGRRGDG